MLFTHGQLRRSRRSRRAHISNKIGNLHIQRMEWVTGEAAILAIEGEVISFDNDFSAAHRRVQDLADQLRGAGLNMS